MSSPGISVLILTKNEQHDLPAALASVAWSDDIHVFDSHSTDATVEIARAAGANVRARVFDDYATHRNAALAMEFKHPWIFLLDADERPTAELSAEMQRVVAEAPANTAGFRLRRRDFFFGTWLKHAQISPYYIRLVRLGTAKYTRAINEVLEVDGPIAELVHPLDHFPFSKGIAHWVAKHNTYSTMEAELIFREQGLANPSLRTALRDPDFHTRRLHQKALFYRLPGRPIIKWCYMMFVRGAVLDGAAGVAYATLQSIYEYMIVLKTRELRSGGA
ncbi:MAG TPA: glycosyltransferase family 2 protein [Acidobacteriaceae bacterium]|nr:glycosyltransferase family 2 protein [Acidobacteriaceae bacterium]